MDQVREVLHPPFSKEIVAQDVVHQGQAAARGCVVISQDHVGPVDDAHGIVGLDQAPEALITVGQELIPCDVRDALVLEDDAEMSS